MKKKYFKPVTEEILFQTVPLLVDSSTDLGLGGGGDPTDEPESPDLLEDLLGLPSFFY